MLLTGINLVLLAVIHRTGNGSGPPTPTSLRRVLPRAPRPLPSLQPGARAGRGFTCGGGRGHSSGCASRPQQPLHRVKGVAALRRCAMLRTLDPATGRCGHLADRRSLPRPPRPHSSTSSPPIHYNVTTLQPHKEPSAELS